MFAILSFALAADVPSREIPPSVLVELQLLQNRFEEALADDCADACYSKGCVWLDHAVADRPRSRSMPGLADEPGPSATEAQEYLTKAQCSFAHEPTVEGAKAQAIVRRLQARLTSGWTVVTVEREQLPALQAAEPVEAEEPAAEEPPAPPPPPKEWTWSDAPKELWDTLLPHFYWMIGLGLFTFAVTMLIWASRRVGKASVEEQALLAQLSQPQEEPPAPAPAQPVEETANDADRAFVAEQEAHWKAVLADVDPEHPDPELQALVRERLRAGDLALLAKAVLRFPDHFPAIFPHDGEIATAKLELAELLQTVQVASLPNDLEFFSALQRHALAARLSSQPDARIVRSLREDFGAAGLVDLIGQLPPRIGSLLFALSPPVEQHEMVGLLSASQVAGLCEQLLRSNRMDPNETRALFEVLRGARGEAAAPAILPSGEITDRGAVFDAAGALAVLLPRLSPATRAAIFDDALARTQGTLPAWTRGILTPDMLFSLPGEARADLLLEIEAEPLAAWFSLADADTRSRLLSGLPDALRMSIQASSSFPSRSRQLALASRARRDLARGFQRQLARARIPFEGVVRPDEEASA